MAGVPRRPQRLDSSSHRHRQDARRGVGADDRSDRRGCVGPREARPAAHAVVDHAAARRWRPTRSNRCAAAVDGLGVPWTVELRTSDTPSSARRRQKERLPTALVTTPESLSLLLSLPRCPGPPRVAEVRRRRRVARVDGHQARRAGRAGPRPPPRPPAGPAHLGVVRHPRQHGRGRVHPARPRPRAGGGVGPCAPTKRPSSWRACCRRRSSGSRGRATWGRGWSRRSRRGSNRPAARWSSPTPGRSRNCGSARSWPPARNGSTGSPSTTGRSTESSGRRSRGCSRTASSAPSSARRASTWASTSGPSTRCCRSAAPRGSAGRCSAPGGAGTGRGRRAGWCACRRRRSSWSSSPPPAAPSTAAPSRAATPSSWRWTCSPSTS